MTDHDTIEDHDRGLAHDLPIMRAMMERRRALRWFAGAGTAALVAGCGGTDGTTAMASTSAVTVSYTAPKRVGADVAGVRYGARSVMVRSWNSPRIAG